MIIEFKIKKRKIHWEDWEMDIDVSVWSNTYLNYKNPELEKLWKKYYHSHIYNEEFIIDDRRFVWNSLANHLAERLGDNVFDV